MPSVGLVADANDKQFLNSSLGRQVLTKRRAASLMASHRGWQSQGWRTPSSPPSRQTPSVPVSPLRSRAATDWSVGAEESSSEFHDLTRPSSSNNEWKKPGSQPMERCDCCSKEDFGSLYDVFEAMDRRGCGTICRADFVWALAALGASSEYQRAVRKTKLSAYFRATVQELSLEDFIHLAFPGASTQDMARMQRWAALRRVRNVLVNQYSQLDETGLQKLFAFLTEDCGGKTILVGELIRMGIIMRHEVLAIMPRELGSTRINFKDFKQLTLTLFSARCASSEGEQDLQYSTKPPESPKHPMPPTATPPTKTRPQVSHRVRVAHFSTDQLAAVAAF